MKKFYLNTLPKATAKLALSFQEQKLAIFDKFYLSGGTGLSLQLGHRESEDLDFFSKESFNLEHLQRELSTFGDLKNTELASGTLNTFLNGVKLQFLEYPYPLLEKTVSWKNIKVSSIVDIACTKLQTIGMRGSKKDFIDLFFILKIYSLEVLLEKLKEKYQKVDYSTTHILKSLVYFVDAENQPMSRIHQAIDWEKIKEKIVQAVRSLNI